MSRLIRSVSALVSMLLLAAVAVAQDASVADPAAAEAVEALRAELPAAGTLVVDPSPETLTATGIEGDATAEVVDAEGAPFAKALRVRVPRQGETAYAQEVRTAPIAAPIAQGDVVLLTVWARSMDVQRESGEGIFAARLQENRPPWSGDLDASHNVGKSWQPIHISGVASRDYRPGEAVATLHIAQSPQTLEFGPVILLNLGQGVDTAALPYTRVDYPGREADAAWRQAAQERIEQHRKGDVTVRVIDAQGNPVEGAQVRVAMQEHAYRFGTFVGYHLTDEGEQPQRLRDFFLENFNAATAPIYWADWGWVRPSNRERYLDQLAWLDERNIPTRGHNIVWPGWRWLPSSVRAFEDQPEALRGIVRTHFQDVLTATAPFRLAEYDVVNEPRTNHDVQDIVGQDVVAEWFELAHRIVPDSRLFLNDYAILTSGGGNTHEIAAYHEQIEQLRAAGAPLGGIGFQGHFGSTLTDPARVLEILDGFAEYGLPLHVTEFDIDTRDEAAQADYTRDFMTAFFSHPATEAIVLWGFWEGDHWRPAGAMLREDFSPKPNYHAYRELVFDQWWTDETLSTDGDGNATTRGFLGAYEVTASKDGRNVSQPATITREGADLTLVLPE